MSRPLRIIFMGTAKFAIPILDALAEGENELLCVISRPAKKAGRGRKLTEPMVAIRAGELNIPVYQPKKPDAEFVNAIVIPFKPDVFVSAAYGAYLPEELLDSAPYGVVNVHPSILPRFMGAEPITRAIMQGVVETGVSFMLTDKGWDTGPVLKCFKAEISISDTTGDVEKRLAEIAATEINSVISKYTSDKLIPKAQVGKPTYAEKLKKSELVIDWNTPAEHIHNIVRALQPTPGARTLFRGKMLKITETELTSVELLTGISSIIGGKLLIGCGTGSLLIKEVQAESGRIMDIQSFQRGNRIEDGETFG